MSPLSAFRSTSVHERPAQGAVKLTRQREHHDAGDDEEHPSNAGQRNVFAQEECGKDNGRCWIGGGHGNDLAGLAQPKCDEEQDE